MDFRPELSLAFFYQICSNLFVVKKVKERKEKIDTAKYVDEKKNSREFLTLESS